MGNNRQKYDQTEGFVDEWLGRIRASPWTAVIVAAVIVGLVVLGWWMG